MLEAEVLPVEEVEEIDEAIVEVDEIEEEEEEELGLTGATHLLNSCFLNKVAESLTESSLEATNS